MEVVMAYTRSDGMWIDDQGKVWEPITAGDIRNPMSVPGGPSGSHAWYGQVTSAPGGYSPPTYDANLNSPQPTGYDGGYVPYSTEAPLSTPPVFDDGSSNNSMPSPNFQTYPGSPYSTYQPQGKPIGDQSERVVALAVMGLIAAVVYAIVMFLIAPFTGGRELSYAILSTTGNPIAPLVAFWCLVGFLVWVEVDVWTPKWIVHGVFGLLMLALTVYPVLAHWEDPLPWIILSVAYIAVAGGIGFALTSSLGKKSFSDIHPRFVWSGAYLPLITMAAGLLAPYNPEMKQCLIGIIVALSLHAIWLSLCSSGETSSSPEPA